MFSPNSLPRRSRVKAAEKLRAVKVGNMNAGESSWKNQKDTTPKNKIVDNFSTATKVVVGADGEKSAVQMRVATSSALGIMAASLPETMLGAVVGALLELLSTASGVQRQVH